MRCQGGCALGVENSAQGGLMLDSEPKDKQKVTRRIARGNDRRCVAHCWSCCLGTVVGRCIVLSAVAVLLCGVVAGGVVVKKMKKFRILLYSKSPLWPYARLYGVAH